MWALVAPGFPRLRTGVALLAFAALAALSAAILPASVAAQAADDEYSLNIPGASSGGGSSHQSSAGTATTAGGDTEPSAPTSAAEAATVTEPVTEQGSGSSSGGNGTDSGGGTKGRANANGSGQGPGTNVTATPSNLDTAPAAAVDSDDSGAPILLIGLAAIAALCTAAAIWRLRQRSDDEDHGIDRDTTAAAGVTGET